MMTDLPSVAEKPGVLAQPSRAFLPTAEAKAIANELAPLVHEAGFVERISGRDYVKAEGWGLLGNLCGLVFRETVVDECENGDWLARGGIWQISQLEGQPLCTASAICGFDEKMWQDRPRHARRSMAVTRCKGKAFRLCLSWIMNLAGFAETPYEEMPQATEKLAGGSPLEDPPPGTEAFIQWRDLINGCQTAEDLKEKSRGIADDMRLSASEIEQLRQLFRTRYAEIERRQ